MISMMVLRAPAGLRIIRLPRKRKMDTATLLPPARTPERHLKVVVWMSSPILPSPRSAEAPFADSARAAGAHDQESKGSTMAARRSNWKARIRRCITRPSCGRDRRSSRGGRKPPQFTVSDRKVRNAAPCVDSRRPPPTRLAGAAKAGDHGSSTYDYCCPLFRPSGADGSIERNRPLTG